MKSLTEGEPGVHEHPGPLIDEALRDPTWGLLLVTRMDQLGEIALSCA